MKNWFPNKDYEIRTIFDYVQTHAIYGVLESNATSVKQVLKERGCTNFRTVKTRIKGLIIICFKFDKSKQIVTI